MKRISNNIAKVDMPQDLLFRPLLLYVEDIEENWQVAELRLKRKYHLLHATTDTEACQLLVKYGPEIVAVLMDIELQGSTLDGIRLTQLIRGTLPMEGVPSSLVCPVLDNIPIVFVTAYGHNYSELELIRCGGDRVIRKPVDFVELSLALTRLHLDRALHVRPTFIP
jgi:CheY-like chemotaxis protein